MQRYRRRTTGPASHSGLIEAQLRDDAVRAPPGPPLARSGCPPGCQPRCTPMNTITDIGNDDEQRPEISRRISQVVIRSPGTRAAYSRAGYPRLGSQRIGHRHHGVKLDLDHRPNPPHRAMADIRPPRVCKHDAVGMIVHPLRRSIVTARCGPDWTMQATRIECGNGSSGCGRAAPDHNRTAVKLVSFDSSSVVVWRSAPASARSISAFYTVAYIVQSGPHRAVTMLRRSGCTIMPTASCLQTLGGRMSAVALWGGLGRWSRSSFTQVAMAYPLAA